MQEILARNKIFAHPDRLGERIKNGITKPITVEIDPTNRCNHKCPFCAGNRLFGSAELSLDNMAHIIDQLKPFVRGIIFTGGGEPFMNTHITDAISYANNFGIEVGVITNGGLLNKYNMGDLVANTKRIRISINGLDKDDFKKKNGLGEDEYNQARTNVMDLVKEKHKQNSQSTIGIGYLTEDNESYKNLRDFSKKAKETGADYVQFRPYHHSKKNIAEYIERCKNEFKDENFDVLYSIEKYERRVYDYKMAFADEFRTVITADGNMYPDCFTRGIKEFCFGNILENTFDEIWNSDKKKQIIQNKLQQKNCPRQCFQEPLNQILWDIYKINKEGKHINFI
ncbi:MAG: radical SAM protein [Candidatus Absconditabacterales bacterium]